MLSGIGPADDLRSHGIDATVDLPGVGLNLKDHLKLSIRWRGKTTLPGSSVTAGLFTSTSSIAPSNLQLYVGRGLESSDDLVTITVSLVCVESGGQVRLRSGDPLAHPIIRAGYLQAQADADALADGVRLARLLGASSAYDALRGEELEPGASVASPPDLDRFIREKSDSIYHAAGTCRMGPASSADSVVDAELRVYGIEGLRVADASIMPEIVNAPTHAACVAIGEKCAALIVGVHAT
jgi:choline dehydrogenase